MKKQYIQIDAENRVTGIGSTPFAVEILVELEDSHEALKNPFIFKYEGGQLIKDVEFQQERIKDKEEKAKLPSTAHRLSMLEEQNAGLMMELIMKDIALEEKSAMISSMDEISSSLLLDLAVKGVI
jgi:hypothetical protein